MAYRSCLDGYLTEGCKTCPDWSDGTNPTQLGVGCACHFPIHWCPHFAQAMRANEEAHRLAKDKEGQV